MASATSPAPEPAREREYHFELPITTDRQLWLYTRLALGIKIPNKRVCAHHSTPWEAYRDAYFAKTSAAVWKASRALAGKTYLMATLGFTEATTMGASVSVLGGSGQQSERVLEYLNSFWYADAVQGSAGPAALLSSEPGKRETRLTNRGRILALAASQTSARGGHPERMRLDEIDEMDWDILVAAMGQAKDRGKAGDKDYIALHTLLSSSHQNTDGTMTAVLKMAKQKNREVPGSFPVYEWCWRETLEPHGWLTESMKDRIRLAVPKVMWDREYDLGEPNEGGKVFSRESLKIIFDEKLGEFEGENGDELVFEEPTEGAWYGTGADWATEEDWTIITTMRGDVGPRRVVVWLRVGRIALAMCRKRFESRVNRYSGAACHDANGIGGPIHQDLTVDAEGLTLRGRDRQDFFAAYLAAVDDGKITGPMVKWAYEEHRDCRWEDLFGSGHPPDSVVAGAMAWRACENGSNEPEIF